MAMLAEPRQRKRYNLVPKGKALFEDGDRFGTKMLEKMGWSKGKGLGRHENGQQEFIRVRYKNDPNGLGFEDRDDQWTEHEKHFNGLLENLNGGDTTTNSTSEECDIATPTVGFGFKSKSASKENMKDKISGQSLEEKSKNSRARVHYKKYTKGKDMSQYSEKDLANIFGKKATPDDTNIYSQFQAFNVGKGENEDDAKEESVKKTPIEIGTHIINTGVSVSDYFKLKMAALKEKKNGEFVNELDNKEEEKNEENEIPIKEKKNKKRSIVVDAEESTPEDPIEEVRPKKKKSKKQAARGKDNETVVSSIVEAVDTDPPKKKKNKTQLAEPELNGSVIQEACPLKKKKSKKTAVIVIESEDENLKEVGDETRSEEENSSSKKKKPKNRLINGVSEDHNNSLPESHAEGIPLKKKKNKKRPVEEIQLTEAPTEYGDSFSNNQIKKKKQNPETYDDLTKDNSSVRETTSQPTEKSLKKKNARKPAEVESEGTTFESAQITDTLVLDNLTSEEKPKKKKKKDKSNQKSSDPTPLIEVSSHHDLNHLKDNCLLDTYTISTFCAEKFRNIELHQFQASNVSEISGYGLSIDLQLNIKTIKGDQERIMRLWSGTLDKYQYATPKRKIYNTYMTKVRQARTAKNRIPKIKVKCLKRKHVFQCL